MGTNKVSRSISRSELKSNTKVNSTPSSPHSRKSKLKNNSSPHNNYQSKNEESDNEGSLRKTTRSNYKLSQILNEINSGKGNLTRGHRNYINNMIGGLSSKLSLHN